MPWPGANKTVSSKTDPGMELNHMRLGFVFSSPDVTSRWTTLALLPFPLFGQEAAFPPDPQLRWTKRKTEQRSRERGMESRGYKTEGEVESKPQGVTEILGQEKSRLLLYGRELASRVH